MKQILLTIILVSSFYDEMLAQQNPELNSFYWLLGTWKMEKKNGFLEETWSRGDGNTLEGSSYYAMQDGERRLLKKTQLILRAKEIFYIPMVSDQNNQKPVFFKITPFTGLGAVAENSDDDFPKRIIYEKIHADSIHARIDDGKDRPEKKSDFYYSKKK